MGRQCMQVVVGMVLLGGLGGRLLERLVALGPAHWEAPVLQLPVEVVQQVPRSTYVSMIIMLVWGIVFLHHA